jgi:hypothetical protein
MAARKSSRCFGGLTTYKENRAYADGQGSTFTARLMVILGLFALPALALGLIIWAELRTTLLA